MELALHASQIGVWEHNLATEEIVWDLQMHRIYATGETRRRISAAMWRDAIHPDDRDRAVDEFRDAAATKDLYDSAFRIVLANGEVRHLRSRGHFYEGRAGAPSYIGAEWDVTSDVLLNRALEDQKAIAEARAFMLERSRIHIEHAADHDYLTGLPNRRYFDRRFMEMLADETIDNIAILHFDLDGFKQINDKSGHAAGDTFLKRAAERISSAVTERDIVARIGGDEFVAVLTNVADADALLNFAEEMNGILRRAVRVGQETMRSGASVGVAWSSREAATNLLADSDLALFQAKKLGRNRVELFTSELQADLHQARQLAEDLQIALERGQIEPFYQVQVDARSRRVVGLEALARWHHPARGILSPGAFLKISDENGRTAEIDDVILRHVLDDRLEWEKQGIAPPRVSVNISVNRLADPQLVDNLLAMNIPPGTLVFELVETIFLDDFDDGMLANIETIKAMGIEIEIDDFGSGHASLVGLVKLKPKRLKIDRQLVAAITVSEKQRRLLASIVEIAKVVGVEVVAEGVESEEHALTLARMGCDILQGYAIGRPVSRAEITELLAARQEADSELAVVT
ncbi:putative bifunctional diguanylate cyclase/phosphodiesterase [Rhizobium sp. RAF56]